MAETKRLSRTNERLQVFTQILSPESHDSESNLLLQVHILNIVFIANKTDVFFENTYISE